MKKTKNLVIVGAGETALLAHEYFSHDSEFNVISFAVEQEHIINETINGLPLIDIKQLKEKYPIDTTYLFIAISSGKLNRQRAYMYEKLKGLGYQFASYISSKAFIWPNVSIGENCFILEDNTIQPFVTIGNNVTLWSGNHLGHRTIIRDNCFISSHCVISGFCEIGENCFLGVNCTIEDEIKVAEDNFIGAGALIQKNTVSQSLYQKKQTELSKINTHRLFRIKE